MEFPMEKAWLIAPQTANAIWVFQAGFHVPSSLY